MWNNKEIKKESKRNLKRNYLACISVCFLLLFFGADYASSDTLLGDAGGWAPTVSPQLSIEEQDSDPVLEKEPGVYFSGFEFNNQLIDNATQNIVNERLKNATTGVMASIAHTVSKTSHAMSFAADAIYKISEKRPVVGVIVSLIGIIASLLYYIFVQVPLRIGERRFFLENRLYHETRATRIFAIYKSKAFKNMAWILIVRAVLIVLWSLTIVGGVIKIYEYRPIMYILAENPHISRKDAFALSKEMTYGHKMDMFKFDLNFIGWAILGWFSLGLVAILFVNPYYRGAQAGVHAALREAAIAANTEHIGLLTDTDLFIESEEERVADIYPGIKIRAKYELSVPWDRHYSILHIALIFFIFAMIGYCWEVVYHFVLDGKLINRGSLWGPWIPIYGVGGAGVVLFLKRLGHRPVVMGICTFFGCGVLEYMTAWYFETFQHMKYWDYSHYLFNIQGRVCLEGLLAFMVLASLGVYIIAPRIDDILLRLPTKLKVVALVILASGFTFDLIFTYFHPHTGEGITGNEMMIADGDSSVDDTILTLHEEVKS